MDIRLAALFIDIVLIFSGFIISFWFRFPQSAFIRDAFRNNFFSLPIIVSLYIISMSVIGVYKKRFKSYFIIAQKTFFGLLLGILFSMSFVYIFRTKWGSLPSSVFFISFPIIFFLIFTLKTTVYRLSNRIFKKVILVGNNEFGNLNTIMNEEVDEFVLAKKSPKIDELYILLRLAEVKRAKLSVLPELYDEVIARKINGKGMLEFMLPAYFQHTPEESLIRISDITISSILLFFALPIMAVIALLIKIYSSGPIIYRQKRIGVNGKEFMLYKFRSMVVGAEQFSRSELIPLEDDERVTKVGRFLRRMRLDELPQLFNVLKGDMSLVGPRPEAVYRVKEHRSLQGIRLSVRPGLTGLAQIEGHYHTLPKHKLRYDYLYIQNRSLRLNFNLLLRTAFVVLTSSGS